MDVEGSRSFGLERISGMLALRMVEITPLIAVHTVT
jgi:hypothetical protein